MINTLQETYLITGPEGKYAKFFYGENQAGVAFWLASADAEERKVFRNVLNSLEDFEEKHESRSRLLNMLPTEVLMEIQAEMEEHTSKHRASLTSEDGRPKMVHPRWSTQDGRLDEGSSGFCQDEESRPPALTSPAPPAASRIDPPLVSFLGPNQMTQRSESMRPVRPRQSFGAKALRKMSHQSTVHRALMWLVSRNSLLREAMSYLHSERVRRSHACALSRLAMTVRNSDRTG